MGEMSERKSRGMDSVAEFVTKAFRPEQMATKEGLSQFFEKTSGAEFFDLINRYFGILNKFPVSNAWRQSAATEDNAYVKGRVPHFIFIPKEQKRNFIEKHFDDIRKLADNVEQNQETIARSLYLLINYSHPLPDGNGRLSRLLYQLFSPNVQDKSKAQLLSASERSEGLIEKHEKMNLTILREMAEARGLSVDDTLAKSGAYPVKLKIALPVTSFEFNGLGFIRAFDLLSPKDRGTYVHKSETGQYYMDLVDLPDAITDNVGIYDTDTGSKERTEFSERLLQRAMNDAHFADELFSTFAR